MATQQHHHATQSSGKESAHSMPQYQTRVCHEVASKNLLRIVPDSSRKMMEVRERKGKQKHFKKGNQQAFPRQPNS